MPESTIRASDTNGASPASEAIDAFGADEATLTDTQRNSTRRGRANLALKQRCRVANAVITAEAPQRPHQMLVKRRSRVLRRRTRQAALGKPRVHGGQLGFAILEQKAAETAENRAFEEKQPSTLSFFYRKPRSWWCEDLRSASLELEAAVGRGKSKIRLVGDYGSTRAHTPLTQLGLVVCCHEKRRCCVRCRSCAREHRRFRYRRAIVEQERRAPVLVKDNRDAVQRKAARDQRDGARDRVGASVLCCVPNRGRGGAYVWPILLIPTSIPGFAIWRAVPGCVNHTRARDRSGCQPPFESW